MSQIFLSQEQENAVALCADLDVKIACVTGQAGTGKTTVLGIAVKETEEAIRVRYNECQEDDIAICAPTGRAAKRIQEATGREAKTIHRLLRFSVPESDDDFGLPAYTKMNSMPFRAIYVDEASMVSVKLRRALIDAMPRNCVIRFFGDINQLPPVNDDPKEKLVSPFAQDLKKFDSVILSKNYRSTDGIIELADRIIKNKMPIGNAQVFINRVIGSQGDNAVMKLAETIDFTRTENQIICPTNTTEHGTQKYNRAIQQRFNPEKDKITVFRKEKDGSVITRSFKRNDKFIWTYNDYNLDMMNGTIGRVVDFDKETGQISVTVEDRDLVIPAQIENYNPTTGEKYTYDPRHYMDLGYAISTHKSQGSQFDTVCFVCSFSRAATRQNVYTAVTRAKKQLHIINIAGSLSRALDNVVNLDG